MTDHTNPEADILLVGTGALNNFVCQPIDMANDVVIEAIDHYPEIKYAFLTPGVAGGVSIVAQGQVWGRCLRGTSGWLLIPTTAVWENSNKQIHIFV